MSRAFAPGESEDDEERFVVKAAVLPPGTPNYITPEGARKLEAERERLIAEKAALPDTVEARQRGKALEQRLAFLTEELSTAKVIDPASQAKDKVRFGAVVTVKDAQGQEQAWRIVGVDETDLDKGWISWISPLARALQEKRVGDTADVNGQKLTLLSIQ